MQEIMTKIELSGVLGKTFGKVHYRLISTSMKPESIICNDPWI
jgi:predicted phage tail protein